MSVTSYYNWIKRLNVPYEYSTSGRELSLYPFVCLTKLNQNKVINGMIITPNHIIRYDIFITRFPIFSIIALIGTHAGLRHHEIAASLQYDFKLICENYSAFSLFEISWSWWNKLFKRKNAPYPFKGKLVYQFFGLNSLTCKLWKFISTLICPCDIICLFMYLRTLEKSFKAYICLIPHRNLANLIVLSGYSIKNLKRRSW